MKSLIRLRVVGAATLLVLSQSGCPDDPGSGTSPENTAAACRDGHDNDGDGLVDCDDPDCGALVFCQVVVTCADDPCDPNATCDDAGGTVVCTCDAGWEGDGTTCEDVDECAAGTDGCAQGCVNAEGGYACTCEAGYVLGADERSCEDVDECAAGTDGCAQVCVDTEGGYACTCEAGYVLGADERACDPVDCGAPDVPPHGSVAAPDGTTFGAIATYDCDPGHYLVGDAERTCDASGLWSGAIPVCAVCDATSGDDCLCEGVVDLVRCQGGAEITCDPDGTLVSVEICGTGLCVEDHGCQVCLAGEVDCHGNEVRSCDPGPPAQWVVDAVCNAAAGERCDAVQGSCITLSPLGSTTPTGVFHSYSVFNQGASTFMGGYDVASYGDLLYVNRGGVNLDVYQVTLLDSDGDGVLEPDQHPDSVQSPGPIEQRTLTYLVTYTSSANLVPLGSAGSAGMHAEADRLYLLGPLTNGDISEWIFASQTATVAADPVVSLALHELGRGAADGLWYAVRSQQRQVFSFHAPTQAWVAEFQWPDLGGGHADGVEVIVEPGTGVQYVYVTDMVMDYLGQYRRDGAGGWIQENLFQYSSMSAPYAEGMTFGTLGHFWVSSGTSLVEVGGGDLTPYLQ